jgi:hypothetical protein
VSQRQFNTRLSADVRALIRSGGAQSADATRALIILGAAAAGLPVGGCLREARRLIARDSLVPEVADALHRLVWGENDTAIHTAIPSAIHTAIRSDSGFSEDDAVANADPLATIGIAV